MNADEDRVFCLVRDPGADLERDEDIVLAGHDDLKSLRLEERPELPRDVEREIFFIPESAGSALVVTAVAGIESVALPPEVQSYSLYVAGINAGSQHVDAAKALIAYLTSETVKQALTANGFEPR